jgi:hypothetical protein
MIEPSKLPGTLTARIRARVDTARLVVERRAEATPETIRLAPTSGTTELSVEELREFQSLRRVFRQLGVSYRRYRSHTGNPATPGLRDAAYNFRAEPSLTSLVAVAAFLDRLDLLN